jgi:hypothetical protein
VVASGHVEITEDEIRIPVMAEEAVIEKRVVGTEEVILRKQQVTETQTVEADLRRERLDVQGAADTVSGSSSTGLSGASGTTDASSGTGGGLGDKLRNAAENVKDRLDGNPRT